MWRHSRRLARPLLAVVSVLFVLACSKEPPREPIILACTTSAQDSGFLAEILPLFQADQPAYSVKPVVVGTGEALRLGQNGDADVLLVHARQAEEAFVAAGHGVERRDLMYNDFVLLGPASDPAGVRGAPEIAPALAVLASADVGFVSRGDDSGTHKKELALWAERADVTEELDRLEAHLGRLEELLSADGPVGRELEFLAQELGREAGTLAAKARSVPLGQTALAIRLAADRIREQARNVE